MAAAARQDRSAYGGNGSSSQPTRASASTGTMARTSSTE